MTLQRQDSLNLIVFSYRSWKVIYRQILAHINSLSGQHREDQADIKDWDDRLNKIDRLIFHWADKNENAAAATRRVSVIKRVVDTLTRLSNEPFIQGMNDEQEFKAFLEAAQNALQALQRPNAGVLGGIVSEEALCLVGGHLPWSDIRSLRMTCRFFQGHENLKKIMNEKFSGCGSMVRGQGHRVILLPNGRAFVGGFECREYGLVGYMKAIKARITWTSLTLPKEAKGVPTKQIAGGYYHTLILLEDGRVFGCGSNCFGQLGLDMDNRRDRHTLTQLTLPEEGMLVEQIAAGGLHTVILLRDGRVFVCGHNEHAQLGLRDTEDRHTLTHLPLPKEALVKKILAWANRDYTLVLLRNGSVLMCGFNHDGNGTAYLRPLPLPEKEVLVEQIIVGAVDDDYSIIILLNDGRVFVRMHKEVEDLRNRNDRGWLPLTLPDGASVKQLLIEDYIPLILLDDGRMLKFKRKSNMYTLQPYKSILREAAEAIAEQEDGRKCVLQ